MKTKLVSLAIAVGLFWGCQTHTVVIKLMRIERPPSLELHVEPETGVVDIDFGPNPGDGGTNVQFGPPGPGSPKDTRQRSYA